MQSSFVYNLYEFGQKYPYWNVSQMGKFSPVHRRGEFYSREADPVASASSSHLLRLLLGSGLTLGAEEDLALYTSRLRNTVPDKNSFIVEVGPRWVLHSFFLAPNGIQFGAKSIEKV